MRQRSRTRFLQRTALCFGYFIFYMTWFLLLQRSENSHYLIRSTLDTCIPFAESFVIPYVIWFPFVGGAFLWMILREDRDTFLRFCAMMFGGMTLALIIFTLFPSGNGLRPSIDAEQSLCHRMVALIYTVDPPSNVFPSLHVYTSAVIALAFHRTRLVSRYPAVYLPLCALSMLIILSTMMIKQHSILDVAAGILLAWLIWRAVCPTRSTAVLLPEEKTRRRSLL